MLCAVGTAEVSVMLAGTICTYKNPAIRRTVSRWSSLTRVRARDETAALILQKNANEDSIKQTGWQRSLRNYSTFR